VDKSTHQDFPSLSTLILCNIMHPLVLFTFFFFFFVHNTFYFILIFDFCGVYAGTRSGKAWNERLFDDAKWAHAVPLGSSKKSNRGARRRSSIELILIFITDATVISFITIYLTKEDKIVYSFSQGVLNNTVNNRNFPFGPIYVAAPLYLPPHDFMPFAASPFQKLRTFTFFAEDKQYIFVSDFLGVAVIYEVFGMLLFYYLLH
jgi:hypothetical protein